MATKKQPVVTQKNITELRIISDSLYNMRDELEELKDEDPSGKKLMYIVGQLTVKIEKLEDRIDDVLNELADKL